MPAVNAGLTACIPDWQFALGSTRATGGLGLILRI
jgi:hypothetical protein